jgi:catechol 2,3-dioxygenase-like lactoylglutathione lyase family enzyme
VPVKPKVKVYFETIACLHWRFELMGPAFKPAVCEKVQVRRLSCDRRTRGASRWSLPPCRILVLRRTLAALLIGTGMVCAPAASAQSRDLTGLGHVAFLVNDLSQSEMFYEKLGFQKAFEFTDAGKVTEAFVKINDRQFIELYPRIKDTQAAGLDHICFETADIASLRAAYVKHGLEPTETKKMRAGNLLFGFRDPEGLWVEYVQYMPDSLHSLDRGKHLGDRVSQQLVEIVLIAKDSAADLAFYTDKLGLEKDQKRRPAELRLPGRSGDKLEIQPAGADVKPRLVFFVEDIRRTRRELRHRGFELRKEGKDVFIDDPDGATIVFTSKYSGTIAKP